MLKILQAEIQRLWTDEAYSKEFKANPAAHRDFQHALQHVMKAVGQLSSMVEVADHSDDREHRFPDSKKYLADLVICALRMAITNPGGQVDLEKAVIERLETKNKVRFSPEEQRFKGAPCTCCHGATCPTHDKVA